MFCNKMDNVGKIPQLSNIGFVGMSRLHKREEVYEINKISFSGILLKTNIAIAKNSSLDLGRDVKQSR